jgi:hypothetical protein
MSSKLSAPHLLPVFHLNGIFGRACFRKISIKLSRLCGVFLLSCLSAAAAGADTQNQGVNLSHFSDILISRGAEGAKVEEDESGNPVLKFVDLGRSFAVYDQGKSAPDTSMDFRITGKTTFGLLLRGMEMDAPSYMVFITRRGTTDDKALVYICKTAFSPEANPYEGKLESKVFPYNSGEWCRLRVVLSENAEGHVEIETSIQRLDDDQILVQLAATDQREPIRQEGQIAIRYFNEGGGEGNALEIRNVEFSNGAN